MMNSPRRLVDLYPHQQKAVSELKTGSILKGGVGSGKSLTAVAYFYQVETDCLRKPKDLYIITTARKRDSFDWQDECAKFSLSTKRECSAKNILVTVDSWNNIQKYIGVKNAFFIFDEQKLVGYGAWVKSFLKIVKFNNWILLSATPGDNWMDYVPVFIANGFFKNKTHFVTQHVVYSTRTRFYKVDHYINTKILEEYRKRITVEMPFNKKTVPHVIPLYAQFNKDQSEYAKENRWNIFKDEPMKDINDCCHVLRKIANTDSSRLLIISELMKKHDRLIIFYNFDYELELLRGFAESRGIYAYEWNGHKHEPVPQQEKWLYFVQYNAGAEAWNCTTTNVIVFYSLNYSYKIMEQTAGRIDRMNTPYVDLYYYVILSHSVMDKAILKALKNKKTFNEKRFLGKSWEQRT